MSVMLAGAALDHIMNILLVQHVTFSSCMAFESRVVLSPVSHLREHWPPAQNIWASAVAKCCI